MISRESLRLTPRAIEGAHEQGLTTFAERSRSDEGLELGDELDASSQNKLGLGPLLLGDKTELLKASDLCLGEGLVGEIRKRGAPPECERFAEASSGSVGVSDSKRLLPSASNRSNRAVSSCSGLSRST